MRLRGRLNQIENRARDIKEEMDNSVPVGTGVWFTDENGDIIPDSGPMTQVPKEQSQAFGILLVPEPVDKEGFQEAVRKCKTYQASL